jgi:hypothetical protein
MSRRKGFQQANQNRPKQPAARDEPEFVTLAQAAHRIGYQPKTLSNWISVGVLRREHGLVKVRGRRRVRLARFLEAFEKGELG